jgi:hypothetical protein
MKPGYKTTEFWLAIASQLLGILVVLGVITPEQQDAFAGALQHIAGAIMMVGSGFGYSLSRGIAKRNGKE